MYSDPKYGYTSNYYQEQGAASSNKATYGSLYRPKSYITPEERKEIIQFLTSPNYRAGDVANFANSHKGSGRKAALEKLQQYLMYTDVSPGKFLDIETYDEAALSILEIPQMNKNVLDYNLNGKVLKATLKFIAFIALAAKEGTTGYSMLELRKGVENIWLPHGSLMYDHYLSLFIKDLFRSFNQTLIRNDEYEFLEGFDVQLWKFFQLSIQVFFQPPDYIAEFVKLWRDVHYKMIDGNMDTYLKEMVFTVDTGLRTLDEALRSPNSDDVWKSMDEETLSSLKSVLKSVMQIDDRKIEGIRKIQRMRLVHLLFLNNKDIGCFLKECNTLQLVSNSEELCTASNFIARKVLSEENYFVEDFPKYRYLDNLIKFTGKILGTRCEAYVPELDIETFNPCDQFSVQRLEQNAERHRELDEHPFIRQSFYVKGILPVFLIICNRVTPLKKFVANPEGRKGHTTICVELYSQFVKGVGELQQSIYTIQHLTSDNFGVEIIDSGKEEEFKLRLVDAGALLELPEHHRSKNQEMKAIVDFGEALFNPQRHRQLPSGLPLKLKLLLGRVRRCASQIDLAEVLRDLETVRNEKITEYNRQLATSLNGNSHHTLYEEVEQVHNTLYEETTRESRKTEQPIGVHSEYCEQVPLVEPQIFTTNSRQIHSLIRFKEYAGTTIFKWFHPLQRSSQIEGTMEEAPFGESLTWIKYVESIKTLPVPIFDEIVMELMRKLADISRKFIYIMPRLTMILVNPKAPRNNRVKFRTDLSNTWFVTTRMNYQLDVSHESFHAEADVLLINGYPAEFLSSPPSFTAHGITDALCRFLLASYFVVSQKCSFLSCSWFPELGTSLKQPAAISFDLFIKCADVMYTRDYFERPLLYEMFDELLKERNERNTVDSSLSSVSDADTGIYLDLKRRSSIKSLQTYSLSGTSDVTVCNINDKYETLPPPLPARQKSGQQMMKKKRALDFSRLLSSLFKRRSKEKKEKNHAQLKQGDKKSRQPPSSVVFYDNSRTQYESSSSYPSDDYESFDIPEDIHDTGIYYECGPVAESKANPIISSRSLPSIPETLNEATEAAPLTKTSSLLDTRKSEFANTDTNVTDNPSVFSGLNSSDSHDIEVNVLPTLSRKPLLPPKPASLSRRKSDLVLKSLGINEEDVNHFCNRKSYSSSVRIAVRKLMDLFLEYLQIESQESRAMRCLTVAEAEHLLSNSQPVVPPRAHHSMILAPVILQNSDHWVLVVCCIRDKVMFLMDINRSTSESVSEEEKNRQHEKEHISAKFKWWLSGLYECSYDWTEMDVTWDAEEGGKTEESDVYVARFAELFLTNDLDTLSKEVEKICNDPASVHRRHVIDILACNAARILCHRFKLQRLPGESFLPPWHAFWQQAELQLESLDCRTLSNSEQAESWLARISAAQEKYINSQQAPLDDTYFVTFNASDVVDEKDNGHCSRELHSSCDQQEACVETVEKSTDDSLGSRTAESYEAVDIHLNVHINEEDAICEL